MRLYLMSSYISKDDFTEGGYRSNGLDPFHNFWGQKWGVAYFPIPLQIPTNTHCSGDSFPQKQEPWGYLGQKWESRKSLNFHRQIQHYESIVPLILTIVVAFRTNKRHLQLNIKENSECIYCIYTLPFSPKLTQSSLHPNIKTALWGRLDSLWLTQCHPTCFHGRAGIQNWVSQSLFQNSNHCTTPGLLIA